MRTTLIAILWVSACLTGTAGPGLAGPPKLPTERPTTPTTPPGTAPPPAAAGDAMAIVNGKPVGMKDLNDILVAAYGLPVAHQLVALEVARQGAAEQGVAEPTEKEIDAEHEMTLRQMFQRLGTPNQYEQHLDRFLQQRNMSRGLWRVIVRRNALLRKVVLKIAGPEIDKVTDEQIREAFYRLYDRKVVVQHIQTKSIADAQKAKELADKGVDFELLVTRYSEATSRKEGGMLPPIGRSTKQISPALRQAALALTKVGQVSNPVQTGTDFHILKLVKLLEPEKVRFAEVKPLLIAGIKEARLSQLRNRYLQGMLAKAKIEFAHPILRDQDAKARKEMAKAPAPPEKGLK